MCFSILCQTYQDFYIFFFCSRRSLLLSCWAFEAEFRPSVDTLIETLSNNTDLVVPCLDAPVSAVAMDCTGSIEMAIPRRQPSRLRMALRISGEHSSHISNGLVPGGGLTISPTSLSLGTDPFGYSSTHPCPNSSGTTAICPNGTLCGTMNGDIGCSTHTSGDLRCRLNSAGLSEVDQRTETVSAGGSLEGSLEGSITGSMEGSLSGSAVGSLDLSNSCSLGVMEQSEVDADSKVMAGPSPGADQLTHPTSVPSSEVDSADDDVNDGDDGDSADVLLDCSPPTPNGSVQIRYMALPPASLEERTDSDYCSDHSKEFWNITAPPAGLTNVPHSAPSRVHVGHGTKNTAV